MNNIEAVKVLNSLLGDLTSLGNLSSVIKDAFTLAITALRAQAEKERRYVVKQTGITWAVYEMPERTCLACHIPTKEAAQAIADIYEVQLPPPVEWEEVWGYSYSGRTHLTKNGNGLSLDALSAHELNTIVRALNEMEGRDGR